MNTLETEVALLDLCQELGGIADANGPFTYWLAKGLARRGTPIGDLTVNELLAISQACNQAFNHPNAGAELQRWARAQALNQPQPAKQETTWRAE